MKKLHRREFVRVLSLLGFGALGAGPLLGGCGDTSRDRPTSSAGSSGDSPARTASPSASPSDGVATAATPSAIPGAASVQATPPPTAGQAYLAVARGSAPAEITQAAVSALGGIGRFVKSGNDVIIKPNICVAYHTYDYAATTNPEVVATLVKLCLSAGAKRVRVMDAPFGGSSEQAYARSGIAEAVKAAGGQMETMTSMKYTDAAIPNGRDLKRWKIYRDILEADVLISVPIAKHHNLARLTLGMKNMMGVIVDRDKMHANLGQRIADINTVVRPHLTVVDAVRILMKNGPTGGNLDDVKLTNTIIASHDVVAADAYATSLFGLKASDIPAIVAGEKMGLGTTDLRNIKVEELGV